MQLDVSLPQVWAHFSTTFLNMILIDFCLKQLDSRIKALQPFSFQRMLRPNKPLKEQLIQMIGNVCLSLLFRTPYLELLFSRSRDISSHLVNVYSKHYPKSSYSSGNHDIYDLHGNVNLSSIVHVKTYYYQIK